jgi:hypothetical protein
MDVPIVQDTQRRRGRYVATRQNFRSDFLAGVWIPAFLVIASEAKQSSRFYDIKEELDCFVAHAPRNDGMVRRIFTQVSLSQE